MGMLRGHFDFAPDAEVSIEVDPRKVTESDVAFLGRLGFNRISVGIQVGKVDHDLLQLRMGHTVTELSTTGPSSRGSSSIKESRWGCCANSDSTRCGLPSRPRPACSMR